jgi:signal transduction histidine kinase
MLLAGRSLRVRLTAISTLVVAFGLAAAGMLLVAALDRSLVASLDESARQRGGDIAALADAGRLADPLPTFGSAVAQVVDEQGRVLAATPGGDRLVSLLEPAELAAARAGAAVTLAGSRLGDSDPYRIVAVPAGSSTDQQTVLVAVPVADQQRTVALVRVAVAIGGVIATAALAVLSWFVVGSALRPVEALRRGAAEISGSQESRRLPDPGTDDEIGRLAATLNDMLARLEGAAMRQRTFVADAAHELRSPLTNMRTELEVALHHPRQATWQATARDALADVTRMSRLVDDLLLLARLDERALENRPVTTIDMHDLASSVGAQHEQVTVAGDSPAPVRGDADALRRIVANLVDNAVRHARSEVCIETTRTPMNTVLSVSDDGPGIPPDDRERVFERFTRLDEGRGRDDGGSGLGLAIVRELVRAHSGTVEITDASPGARIVVTLPT